MFPLQQKIHDSLPDIEALLQRYQQPLSALDAIKPDVLEFKVRVPLVGAFSAGKSSLLNALLGEKLLSVQIDPATSLATELHAASEEQLIGHLAGGGTITLTRDTLLQQQFGDLVPDGWIEARLRSAALEQYPHLCLVDMPGLDSGLKSHATAIDSYIGRSQAYCLVMGADDGALNQSTRDFLQELALHKMPVIAIVTKADKKLAEELGHIVTLLRQELAELVEPDLLKVVSVSARKKMIAPFAEALAELEQRAEHRFKETVGVRAVQCLAMLEKELSVLINKDDLDSEQLEQQQRDLEQEMQLFRKKLAGESDALHAQVEPVLMRILDMVGNRLTAQLESLAAIVQQGGDLNGAVGHTVRLVVTEGMQRELAPIIQRYAERVEAELPESIRISNSFRFDAEEGLNLDPAMISSVLTSLAETLLKRFPVLALVMPMLRHVLERFVDSKLRAFEAEQRREAAREHVLLVVIPQVRQQLTETLRHHVLKLVEEAGRKIGEVVEARSEQHRAALALLESQLAAGQQAFDKARQGYLQDQKKVREWIQEFAA